MDKTFHEIQANIVRRLIHSDRHQWRKSIGPDLVTCSSKNRDLSRLRMKNEILFKDLEGHLTNLELEQRRRHDEMMRSVKTLTSFPVARKRDELTKRTNTKAKEKLSVLAKHLHVIKNDISISEERLGRWRETFRERGDTPNTRKKTVRLPSKLGRQNMPAVPLDGNDDEVMNDNCDKCTSGKTSERPLRFSKVFPKEFSLRSTAHHETSVSHFNSHAGGI